MHIKFKTDKQGKILDSDELFDKIDDQLDNEEYDAVVSEILSIPREKWSNKLWFKLICAYSNQREFDKAEKELDMVAELCETPNDIARCHYSRGYLCYMNDKEIMAREHYRDAAKIDPEYAESIDLEDDINECSRIIAEDLAGFHAMCAKINADIKDRCGEKSQKKNISEEDFQMRLGFFSGIRKLPGFERSMGFENYFAEYKGEDKVKCLKWFENFYGITDEESLFKHIQNDGGCNIARMAYDVAAYIIGKPNFDINELNEGGRFAFENTVMFSKQFFEFLPKSGVLAWDISEKIGFMRHANRCGLIGSKVYCMNMQALSDTAKKYFSSWEEYMRSLIFGSALFVFSIDEWSTTSAENFISHMAPMLLRSDLADVMWCVSEN